MDQTNILENIKKFDDKSRPETKEGKDKKRNNFDSVSALYECWELTLNTFRSGIFLIKEKEGKGSPLDLATQLKILTPKQILQRLAISLAQVKVGNKSELTKLNQINYIFLISSKRNY